MESISLTQLKSNPKNPNRHSPEQIERLAKLIQYQGFRVPVIVSNRSGFTNPRPAPHGTLEIRPNTGEMTLEAIK